MYSPSAEIDTFLTLEPMLYSQIGVLLFFPNKSPQIKSYILLKINFQEDMFVVAMGSKDINKFNPDQQVDLIEYLIKVIENKIHQL